MFLCPCRAEHSLYLQVFRILTAAWHGQNLRDILITMGHNVDIPWKKLPKKDRDWILFTEEKLRVLYMQVSRMRK
jgi:excinuclease UvrABC ATPase subunit